MKDKKVLIKLKKLDLIQIVLEEPFLVRIQWAKSGDNLTKLTRQIEKSKFIKKISLYDKSNVIGHKPILSA